MRAFASGCTAMTGVEAVSNGVTRVPRTGRRPCPHGPSRRSSCSWPSCWPESPICAGPTASAATEPGEPGYQSILSQLVAAVVGRGIFYYITIGSVLAVLALSANTGFADFPRLCRVIAQDGFLPSGFAHRGRRLVYSHGILVLAVLSAGLLIVFGGITDNLIPLFAVGAFLAFTLSQAGMVVHWRSAAGRTPASRWRSTATGAVCTAVTLVVVLVSKFAEGAWVMVLLDPGAAGPVHQRARPLPVRRPRRSPATSRWTLQDLEPPRRAVPIRGWSAITRKAMRFALKISPDIYALHVADDEQAMVALEDGWERRVLEPARAAELSAPKLIVIYSPYRRLYAPLKQVVTDLQRAHPGRDIAVIVPELVGDSLVSYSLHNQTGVL